MVLETNGMNHRTYPVHGVVHTLQRLKPLGHQEIRELFVNGLHFLRDLQYPLLVGIRRVVVGRGARRNEKRRKIDGSFLDDSPEIPVSRLSESRERECNRVLCVTRIETRTIPSRANRPSRN